MVYWMFFCPTFPASRTSCTYTSVYLPRNSQTFKSQLKILCIQVFAQRNLCEKLPKAVSFASVQINTNIIVRIGAAKVPALDNRIFRQSIQFPWLYTSTVQSPEQWNEPLSAPLFTHSNAFGPWFLNLEKSKLSEMDPWHFPHILPSPWLNKCIQNMSNISKDISSTDTHQLHLNYGE